MAFLVCGRLSERQVTPDGEVRDSKNACCSKDESSRRPEMRGRAKQRRDGETESLNMAVNRKTRQRVGVVVDGQQELEQDPNPKFRLCR